MKKKILIILLLVMAIGASVAAYLYNKPAATTVSGEADYKITAAELFAKFEENEEAANALYLNKILAVTGKIASVADAENGSVTLTLESGNEMFGVSCELNEALDKASLKPGETVTVKGLCTGMLMDVVLVKCSIEN